MKIHRSHITASALAILATLSLTGCTYYHTTEQEAAPARAPNTVVVPQSRPSVVIPKPQARDTDTVVVAPDSTVTVTPRPYE